MGIAIDKTEASYYHAATSNQGARMRGDDDRAGHLF